MRDVRMKTQRSGAAPPPGEARDAGSVLVIVMVMTMSFGFMVAYFLQSASVQSRAARTRLGSVEALYEAFGELEKAKLLIDDSNYSQAGNVVIQAALTAPEAKIAGTDVVVSPLGGLLVRLAGDRRLRYRL